MSEKPVIFISHSSKDKDLAKHVQNLLIESWNGFVNNVESTSGLPYIVLVKQEFGEIKLNKGQFQTFFVSSSPDTIPVGANWQETVIKNLDEANIFIPIITQNSVNNRWVWFEIGYFWSKTKRFKHLSFAH